MLRLSGKSVYKGIALGPVVVLKPHDQQIKRETVEDADGEIFRLGRAGAQARSQLQELYDKAVKEVGKAGAAIFEVHQMLLEDEDYLEAIHNMIRTELVNAEYAVAVTGDNFAEMFGNMDDDYMKARAADIKDISNRLVRNLTGDEEIDFASMEPAIIVANDLSPSETVQMDKEKILGFVTVHGSTNSHTAILARMMNIPALIGVPMELDKIHTGMTAIVDGFNGKAVFEPTEELCREAQMRMREEEEKRQLLKNLKGKKNVTLDGREINIYANIGNVGDIGYALENDAGGIGLFRSEFLYIGKIDFPTEEEQFQAYKKVVQNMAGKKVIIRTLDIGADKQADYFDLGKEENPALGYRAIRICLKQKSIFKTQLRALFRAAVFGDMSIMYPMIISTQEVLQIYRIVDEVEAELAKEGVPYKVPEQGIMIETPAAVMISEELAQMVDFFSIGTNDLTQYTLAIDRQNAKLDDFYNPHHTAILRMIQIVVDSAHKYGKWAGICGELGADPELTEKFVRMGVDELSVSPSMILKLRKIVREMYVSSDKGQMGKGQTINKETEED
ncbi:MAG: phosphoenolpyruvate--protein phosphotransferase [Eubacteriales bacterium]|nr:phosphoenolpyruvate--protein phosphotransferase [Eubacteriales bacterium]